MCTERCKVTVALVICESSTTDKSMGLLHMWVTVQEILKPSCLRRAMIKQ